MEKVEVTVREFQSPSCPNQAGAMNLKTSTINQVWSEDPVHPFDIRVSRVGTRERK